MRLLLILSMVLVACGDDSNVGTLPDAPNPPDAVPMDGNVTPQPVTLTVTLNGAPAAGVHTYFLNADNSVVKTADTDSTGVASATMVAGGSVTAINPFVGPPAGIRTDDLRTFVGVKPGDHLVLSQNSGPGLPSVRITLSAPAFTGGTATSYDVFTTCGNGAIQVVNNGVLPLGPNDPTGQVDLFGCNGTADILVVANGFGGNEQIQPLGSLYHANVAVADGADITLTDAYDDLQDVKFEYTNLAPSVSSVSVRHDVATSHGVIQTFNGSTGIDGTTALITLSEMQIPSAVGAIDSTIQMRSQHEVIQRKSVTTSNTFDLAGLLPDIVNGSFYNATTKRVSWQEAATGVRPDLTIVELDVTQQGGGGSNVPPPRAWHWQLVAPYAPGGELTYPTLPTDVANWAPNPGDNVNVNGVTNIKVPGGYDVLRGQVFNVEDPSVLVTAPTDVLLAVSFNQNVAVAPAISARASASRPLAKPWFLSRR